MLLKSKLSFGRPTSTKSIGEAFSDFDLQLEPRAPAQTSNEGLREGGRYRVRIDKSVRGTINGGGQAIQFKNYNGNIYIRRTGTYAAATPKD